MNHDRSVPWADTPLHDRLSWAARFRAAIANDAPTLCSLVSAETGKPEWETVTSDLAPLLASCRWHERNAVRILSPQRVGGRPVFLLATRQRLERAPIGRVAIIATWNYPIQLLGIQLLQALLAGNTLVVKPSEHVPRTQHRLIQLAVNAGLPDRTIDLRPATRDAGKVMLDTERFDHVVFTGSTSVGERIAGSLARTLTPSTLELSGRDSALVLHDADPELAAACIWNAVVMNAGQTCMAPRRALVDARIYRSFLAALSPLAAGAKPVRLISAEAAMLAHALAVRAVNAGGRSLSGVLEPPAPVTGSHADLPRNTLRPLAIVDCPATSELVGGDHFGPVLAVLPFSGIDHALSIHSRCGAHLATSVFTRSPRRAHRLAPSLGTGVVTVNDTVLPTGHPGVPISGRGPSGWGSSRGEAGLLAMTRPIQISETRGALRPPLHMPAPAAARTVMRILLRWYGASRGSHLPVSVEHHPVPLTPQETRPQRPLTPHHEPSHGHSPVPRA